MTSKKELLLAYGLAIYFLLVGVLCYAAFSSTESDIPIRISYKSATGNVLFDHKRHVSDQGYGLSCQDCHHTLEEDETEGAQSCSECHEAESEDEDVLKHSDALHKQCIDCHREFEKGPEECTACHLK
jgi:hypothetical protein